MLEIPLEQEVQGALEYGPRKASGVRTTPISVAVKLFPTKENFFEGFTKRSIDIGSDRHRGKSPIREVGRATYVQCLAECGVASCVACPDIFCSSNWEEFHTPALP